MSNFMVKSHKKMVFLGRMVLEWRECEHEDVDREVISEVNAKQALRRCGLYKFWNLGCLMAQPRVLQMFMDYCNLDTEAFILDGMPLRLEVEDIYFITGLSYRDELVKLQAHGVGGGITIEEYIFVYFLLDTERIGI